jgi:hypothetical protein
MTMALLLGTVSLIVLRVLEHGDSSSTTYSPGLNVTNTNPQHARLNHHLLQDGGGSPQKTRLPVVPSRGVVRTGDGHVI